MDIGIEKGDQPGPKQPDGIRGRIKIAQIGRGVDILGIPGGIGRDLLEGVKAGAGRNRWPHLFVQCPAVVVVERK